MATGLVRAAFCSLLTESVNLSERNKKSREDVPASLLPKPVEPSLF